MPTRHTITFDPALPSIDEPLNKIQKLGAAPESAQRFIGTAIIEASFEQIERAQSAGRF